MNWEEWGLYDYLQVVKIPMDLGTIRNKLSKNEYKKPVEFARDVRLVWDNCKLYNQVRAVPSYATCLCTAGADDALGGKSRMVRSCTTSPMGSPRGSKTE